MNKLLPHLSQREVQAPQAPEPSKATVNVPAGVSDTEQKVLELLCDGLSNAEAAQVLGIGVNAYAARLSRARRRLRALLEPTPEDRKGVQR